MENKIKGGKADKLSIEDIARKHSVFVGTIKKELEIGLKVEKEHTDDPEKAKEIAMDHLTEFPDYYTRLHKMEKEADASKKSEAKEQMNAGASGSYETALSSPISRSINTVFEMKKKDIPNWRSKQKEVDEQMDAGISAGAMYDGPIGTAGPSSPMDKSKKKRKDPLKIDNAESKMEGASITGASTKDMISTKKGFPRFGGPEGKFVEINKQCKTFPYCDQGASSDRAFKGRPNPIKLKEVYGLRNAIQEASEKYKLPVEEISKIVIKEMMQSNEGIEDMFSGSNLKAVQGWGDMYRDAKTKKEYMVEVPVKSELLKLKLSESEWMSLERALRKNGIEDYGVERID